MKTFRRLSPWRAIITMIILQSQTIYCIESSHAIHLEKIGNGLRRQSRSKRVARRKLKRDNSGFEEDISSNAASMLRVRASSCGDNLCDLDENSATCSEDCSELIFTPSATGGNGAIGTMFAVRAIRDLVVTSLNFHAGKKSGSQMVQVYTRKGVFRGFELKQAGWDLIYNNTMDVNKRQMATPLVGGFYNPINILSGEIRSFFVYTTAKVLYDVGGPDDMLVSSDGNMEFLGGIGKVTKFEGEASSSIAVNRIFRGQLIYDIISKSNVTENINSFSLDPPDHPSMIPSTNPTVIASTAPTLKPVLTPADTLSIEPSFLPENINGLNTNSSTYPSPSPTIIPPKLSPPTKKPITLPTRRPSHRPIASSQVSKPTMKPTRKPTSVPTSIPTRRPTLKPTSDTKNLVMVGDNGFPEGRYPLSRCEGDCDYHSDCAKGLLCFQRSGLDEVPGCEGSGVSGKDYCYDPTTASPTPFPTNFPTLSHPPSDEPSTAEPTLSHAPSLETAFVRGDLLQHVPQLGIRMCTGMNVRLIARAGHKVTFTNGKKSNQNFHGMPDGAAIFSLSEGGYVYVSNSEMRNSEGGVYGLYFNDFGEVVDYKVLLSKTKRNCSGGKTPWDTWVSCEETGSGQCWQVDPTGLKKPQVTKLGGNGGNFESVAVDNRNPSSPVFYVTEDHESGRLIQYTVLPSKNERPQWDWLHSEQADVKYLVFLDNKRFVWSSNIEEGRISQSLYFRNVEGIDFKDGMLYFVSKKLSLLFVLDLENGTYTSTSTEGGLLGRGSFYSSPDQIVRNNGGEFLYLTEDGGRNAGVYAIDVAGNRYAIFEAYDDMYRGDETTGLAFTPDGKKMYASFQDCGCEDSDNHDCGCLLEFSRVDGKSFDGNTLSLKFHSSL